MQENTVRAIDLDLHTFKIARKLRADLGIFVWEPVYKYATYYMQIIKLRFVLLIVNLLHIFNI